ncbi:hypothetical protein [Streptomyces sp. 6N223]|uniref:hypothetical protein n=1 Tax=Streptomyces sp. 6N223 TaxID=3457412 RepID=UPI003FD45CDC
MRLAKNFTLIAMLAVCTFSCTNAGDGERREYDIPKPLCKIDVDPSLYGPLFPPGESVDVTDYNDDIGGGHLSATGECIVDVDGARAIYIEIRAADSSLHSGVDFYLLNYLDRRGDVGTYTLHDARQVADRPRETWVWPDFAATSLLCASSSVDFPAIIVSVRLDWVGSEDYSEQLQDFIGPFADEQLRRIGERACTPA